ncbi:hypothetical protein Ocin01_14668 [Orchesella cincta]|uniref:Uncharacterized protein n=1 Tax=Orchesella cincta TaxID=48709 RepID=A0A1D2MG86_ORCCI|nr:hypothetical protein Ocin01_14668 [Orchesella cincta]
MPSVCLGTVQTLRSPRATLNMKGKLNCALLTRGMPVR